MADTYFIWLAKNITLNLGASGGSQSYEVPDVRNFDQAIISLEAGGQSGTTPTLDTDVELGHSRWNTLTEDAYWTRVQTKNLGSITGLPGSPVFTAGDYTFGLFTQITSSTTFATVQHRGLDTLLGDRLRVTLRVGGSATPTFTNVMLYVLLKTSGVETSGVS